MNGNSILDSLTLYRLVIFEDFPGKDEALALNGSFRTHYLGNLLFQLTRVSEGETCMCVRKCVSESARNSL